MDCLLVFNLSRNLISSFIIIYLFFLFFLFQIWLQEMLRLLQPPTVPLSTYLPRHLRDCRLQNVMGFEKYLEFMGRLKETDI